MPTLETYNGYYLWHYVPNVAAAVIYAVLFLIITIAHTWKMFRHRTWFCIPFVIGGFLEVMGYAVRADAAYHTGVLTPYLIQSIGLILPPVFFAATLYMVYSHIVRGVQGQSFSPISDRWATRIFVTGDILCMLIQSSGAGMTANSSNAKMGDNIVVGGLILQIVIFVIFVSCCITFHVRFRAHTAQSANINTLSIPWQKHLNMLYYTSVTILIRNIYRVVEFVMGVSSGFFADNEWPLYVFDSLLMLFVMTAFYVWYPTQLASIKRFSTIELVSS